MAVAKRVPARLAQPAPGVQEGFCWCGCGERLRKPGHQFFSRSCRSTCAPDGRLVTEHRTKWCLACQVRKPIEQFPTKNFHYKQHYYVKAGTDCDVCTKDRLSELTKSPEAKARNVIRQRERYQSDPYVRARRKETSAARARRVKEDPQLAAQETERRKEQWERYSVVLKQRRAELRAERLLDQNDPLVIPKSDPLVRWLYEQVDRYLEDRGMSGAQVLGETMGRNWHRWHPDGTTNGSKYMPMTAVDQVLVRLGLQHRFSDFEFRRRSEFKADSWEGNRRAKQAIKSGEPGKRSGARSG